MLDDTVKKIMKSACGLDATFTFGCKKCGRCCKHRTDIILNPEDIFRIAQYFQRRPIEIIERYCNMDTRNTSKLPYVYIKPDGQDEACPFLREKKCIIHKAKPVMCAIYPLGRLISLEKMKVEYIIQATHCGNGQETYTVREWITKFGYENDDEFFFLYQDILLFLGGFMIEYKEKLTRRTINNLYYTMKSYLYLEYDIKQPFLPQFKSNVHKLKLIIEDLKLE